MKGPFIGLNQAKLAKKLGFDWEVTQFYCYSSAPVKLIHPNKTPRRNYNSEYISKSRGSLCYSAPSFSNFNLWLREKHFLTIIVEPTSYGDSVVSVKNLWGLTVVDGWECSGVFYTFEEAFNFGVLKALEYIKEPKQDVKLGKWYQHVNGIKYMPLFLVNEKTKSPDKHPISVVYKNEKGDRWVKTLDDWKNKMSLIKT